MMGTKLAQRIRVHALKAGTWPANPEDVTLSEADIAGIAASYNPSTYKAPVVIGHPKTDDPAWGWVEAAEANSNGLYVDATLTPEMAELVKRGQYSKVSCSLYTPAASANPTPGSWSLRHLGFLGAEPPAVKGLEMVRLAEEDAGGTVEVQWSMDSGQLTMSEAGNIPLNPPSKGDLQAGKAKDMTDTEKQKLEQQTADLAERAKTLETREAAVAARERQLTRAVIGAEIDGHIQGGRVLPVEKPGLVALMELADGQTVDLSESEKDVKAGDVLRSLLKALPARVDLTERSAPDRAGGTPAVPGAKAPDGFTLSERGSAVDLRARQLMAAKPGLSYVDAVRQAEALG